MKWNLTVDVEMAQPFRRLDHREPVLSIGSCFSQNMGGKLDGHRWKISNNPFGILYNPYSVLNAMERILACHHYSKADLVETDGRYVSMDHHGDLSGSDPADVVRRINTAIDLANRILKSDNATVILTFGTAYYYTWQRTGKRVGNCHKIPEREFTRARMDAGQIVELYAGFFEQLRKIHPGLQWILSVSPVRHWKDGGADNHWSKSILTCAVRDLADAFDNVHYFPAYEIMMDELRDYRFYKEDMVHPTDQAIDHIWERFSSACLSREAILLNSEIRSVNMRLEHRPIRPESPEHQEFLEETNKQIGILKNKYPHIEF